MVDSVAATSRTRDTEKTRLLILEAASDLFIREGYDVVSVRKIAAQANISHGTIYIHFKDKDDLLYQASEEQFSRLLSRLRRLPRSREPFQRLTDALLAAMRFGLDHPNEYQLMMGLRTTFGGPKSPNQWGPTADQVGAFFRDILREASAASGKTGDDDDALDELMLLGLIHGVVLEGSDDSTGRDRAEQLAERAVETFVAGLQNRAPRR